MFPARCSTGKANTISFTPAHESIDVMDHWILMVRGYPYWVSDRLSTTNQKAALRIVRNWYYSGPPQVILVSSLPQFHARNVRSLRQLVNRSRHGDVNVATGVRFIRQTRFGSGNRSVGASGSRAMNRIAQAILGQS